MIQIMLHDTAHLFVKYINIKQLIKYYPSLTKSYEMRQFFIRAKLGPNIQFPLDSQFSEDSDIKYAQPGDIQIDDSARISHLIDAFCLKYMPGISQDPTALLNAKIYQTKDDCENDRYIDRFLTLAEAGIPDDQVLFFSYDVDHIDHLRIYGTRADGTKPNRKEPRDLVKEDPAELHNKMIQRKKEHERELRRIENEERRDYILLIRDSILVAESLGMTGTVKDLREKFRFWVL